MNFKKYNILKKIDQESCLDFLTLNFTEDTCINIEKLSEYLFPVLSKEFINCVFTEDSYLELVVVSSKEEICTIGSHFYEGNDESNWWYLPKSTLDGIRNILCIDQFIDLHVLLTGTFDVKSLPYFIHAFPSSKLTYMEGFKTAKVTIHTKDLIK